MMTIHGSKAFLCAVIKAARFLWPGVAVLLARNTQLKKHTVTIRSVYPRILKENVDGEGETRKKR